jgi:hypothetical protein
MVDLMTLFELVDSLPSDQKQALLEHLQRQQEQAQPVLERIFDLHPGAMEMSADFDDDLPDSFWFGE